MAEIVPAILTSEFSDYAEKMDSLVGITNRVQVDIIDGKFVNNQTISMESLKNIETNLQIDLHLMVKEPEGWVNRALEVLPDRLIGQVEMMVDPLKFINETVEGGMGVGLALDLETPVETISDEIYHMVDLVLVLAAKAGFSGQGFNEKALEKIGKIRKIVGDLVDVGVDCGMNEETIPLCQKAGANIFYVTSSFWQAEDLPAGRQVLAKRYQELTSLIA